MVISRDALRATDHARGIGEFRDFLPRELDCAERAEAVREPMMNWSVVTIRLFKRAPNCGTTENNCRRQRAIQMNRE